MLPTLPCCRAALSALERTVYSALSGRMFYKCQLGAVAATRSLRVHPSPSLLLPTWSIQQEWSAEASKLSCLFVCFSLPFYAVWIWVQRHAFKTALLIPAPRRLHWVVSGFSPNIRVSGSVWREVLGKRAGVPALHRHHFPFLPSLYLIWANLIKKNLAHIRCSSSMIKCYHSRSLFPPKNTWSGLSQNYPTTLYQFLL